MSINFKFFWLIIIIIGIGCLKSKKQDIYYIINHPSIVKVQSSSIPPPPSPPNFFYGVHNFILRDSSRVYYYKLTGDNIHNNEFNMAEPEKINLLYDSIHEIKIAELQSFLEESIRSSTQNEIKVTASISYPSDTITNRAYKIITDYFKQQGINIYNVRNWTDEERETMKKIN